MNHARTLLPSLTLVAVLPAAAQSTIHTFQETEAQAGAGTSVALWDDLDGDGRVEWVVGAPRQDTTQTDAGRFRVFSGASGLELYHVDGAVPDGRLGSSLANVGDLDGDGVDELAVGAWGERTVRVYSGGTQALLWSRTEAARVRFGWCVEAAGDVNGDGQLDVVVGANQDDSILVLSGADGSTVLDVRMAALGQFGFSVAALGDLNGDGFDDLAVGAPFTFNAIYNEGAVVILLGPNGTVAHTHRPSGFDDRGQEFGWSVAGPGDVDGDGVPDYAVGARYYGALHFIDDNFVSVHSGATHAELHRIEGGSDQWFGYSMDLAGDADGDGATDLLIGNPYGHEVVLYSPKRNVAIHTYETAEFQFGGESVAGGKDVDGDGFVDFVHGTSVQFSSSLPTAGSATVFTLGCPRDAVYRYCDAAPNSASAAGASLGHLGSPSLASGGMRFYATQTPTNTFAVFFHGTEEAYNPIGFGAVCVGGAVTRLSPVAPTGPNGTPSVDVDPTTLGVVPGDTRFFQCWMRDNLGGTPGFNFSDGLRVVFCP